MTFPDHIAEVLERFGIASDTKAALYDLYVSMGNEVLEVFGDLSERVASPSELRPEDTATIRKGVVERYLVRNHPRWLSGLPTPSLWYPRVTEGRASGMAVPLGAIPDAARRAIGDAQPVPDGIVVMGKNAHYGGRQETISFDVIPADLDDAIAVGTAIGQQHTLPGSIGETSGTFDPATNVALIWEVQPNVYKPQGDRNREIAKVYRRHRNWHIATLAAALDWLRQRDAATFILRGEALAATHEVNPEKPVSEMIVSLHNRTVSEVTKALSLPLRELTKDDEMLILPSIVMNHALRQHVMVHGVSSVMWRVELL